MTSSPQGVNEGRRLSDSSGAPSHARLGQSMRGHVRADRWVTAHKEVEPGRLTVGGFPRGGFRTQTAAEIDQRGGGFLRANPPEQPVAIAAG